MLALSMSIKYGVGSSKQKIRQEIKDIQTGKKKYCLQMT